MPKIRSAAIVRVTACFLALVAAVLAPACSTAEVSGMPPYVDSQCGGALLKRNAKLEKIDLLFVIDNSPSMADKQAILADAVPELVSRLTNPVCVDRDTRAYAASPAAGEACPGGSAQVREFEPVTDVHIGVITSSLGGHGADSCSQGSTGEYNPRQEDMSHLIVRGKNADDATFHDVATYGGKGFLNWDPMSWDTPPGDSDADRFAQKFAELVRGAGDDGCRFESTLEAWYRFLADPAPYARMIPCPCYEGETDQLCRCPDGIDTTVLQQRADMIRQDSLLVVVMLSDENDCSVMDGGQNFLALQARAGTQPFHLKRGTSACDTDPWSADCKSCWEADLASHPECQTGWSNPEKDDPLDLRCLDQKRRFGVNFLQPVRRYVEALTERRFADNTINPVFCSKYATKPDPDNPNATVIDRENCGGTLGLRDPSQVFLAGIVGVPWQDIARDPNDLSAGYRTAWELNQPVSMLDNAPESLPSDTTLWDVILGGTSADGELVPTDPPLDPWMIESVDPRSGTNPITGDSLAPTNGGPLDNGINGSERVIDARDDLQYACIFDLPAPLPAGRDCTSSPENPLCYDGTGYGTVQYRAKAYPSRRQLAALKGVGDQGIVASICPGKLAPNQKDDPDWGYRPAIAGIVDRLKSTLQASCFPHQFSLAEDSSIPCTILEATRSTDVDANGEVLCPPCEGGRVPASAEVAACMATDMTFVENGMNCLCELRQFSDPAELRSCIEDTQLDPSLEGWCYVDGNQDPLANQTVLATCPTDQKRIIRFTGRDVPRSGSLTFIRCTAGSL